MPKTAAKKPAKTGRKRGPKPVTVAIPPTQVGAVISAMLTTRKPSKK